MAHACINHLAAWQLTDILCTPSISGLKYSASPNMPPVMSAMMASHLQHSVNVMHECVSTTMKLFACV